MGNNTSNSVEKRRKKHFPLKLQSFSTGWKLTKEHIKEIEQAFSRYRLQDVLTIFLSLLGEHDNFRMYYRLTRPDLCDMNLDNSLSTNYPISADWLSLFNYFGRIFCLALWPYSKQKAIYTITIVGEPGCGKSNLAYRMATGKFVGSCDPTIEELFRIQIQLDKNNDCSIDILDTAEMEEFIPLRENPIDEVTVLSLDIIYVKQTHQTKQLRKIISKMITLILIILLICANKKIFVMLKLQPKIISIYNFYFNLLFITYGLILLRIEMSFYCYLEKQQKKKLNGIVKYLLLIFEKSVIFL
ncbi:hypothetical protein RFI_29943 [Reticulomyxa filosa]|uniref:Uncharacterized protein n=1 Tax=Reticulomyxa filosa TaxID=46433 RepID=X6M353_RETFI|nr:hypothetical protein RFI_29943 [Reticulomyxa filosa]|eukprot:ETO07450.1 hypothetical protein RFI_29943 [Reticulomyxa filosa]